MNSPVRATNDGIEIDVHVVPRASKTRILGVHGERLKISLAAPPVDSVVHAAAKPPLPKAVNWRPV